MYHNKVEGDILWVSKVSRHISERKFSMGRWFTLCMFHALSDTKLVLHCLSSAPSFKGSRLSEPGKQ